MRFEKCAKQNVFAGCSQKPHGHLRSSHGVDLVANPQLTTKEVAKRVARSTVDVFKGHSVLKKLGRDPTGHEELIARLEAEIDATDLPDL